MIQCSVSPRVDGNTQAASATRRASVSLRCGGSSWASFLSTIERSAGAGLALQDLADDEWIVFSKCLQPTVHNAIMETARTEGISPKCTHDMITVEHAVRLVSENLGVATLPGLSSAVRTEQVIARPLSNPSLSFETFLIMRADNDSRLVNNFARSFLRKFGPQRISERRMQLSLSA